MLKILATAAAFALACAGAASAVTVTFGPTPELSFANPTPTWINGTYFDNVTGSVPGERRSPWQGSAVEGTAPYSAVGGHGSAAFFRFGSVRSQLSLVYGSPDPYNKIDFFLDGVLVDTFPGTGNGANFADAFATFDDIGATGLFDKVVLSSDQPAFEFANLSAIPLPAGGVLLLTALGAVGLAGRRKAA